MNSKEALIQPQINEAPVLPCVIVGVNGERTIFDLSTILTMALNEERRTGEFRQSALRHDVVRAALNSNPSDPSFYAVFSTQVEKLIIRNNDERLLPDRDECAFWQFICNRRTPQALGLVQELEEQKDDLSVLWMCFSVRRQIARGDIPEKEAGDKLFQINLHIPDELSPVGEEVLREIVNFDFTRLS